MGEVKRMKRFDFVAIGCGPYNLGLMALAEKTELHGVCFEKRAEMMWHEGRDEDANTLFTRSRHVGGPDPFASFLNYLSH